MVNKLIDQIKDYGGTIILVLAMLVSITVAYGSSQATTSLTFANHENRITTLEQHDRLYDEELTRIDQKVTDIWKDNGHKE